MSKDNLTDGDLQKILEHIDKNSKKQSLDNALLFFSTFIGLLFTIISTLWRDLLYYFLPTLFIGWFLPVYIGFIRGSLIKDSVEERVRGWIYLIAGTGLYLSCITIIVITKDIGKRLDLSIVTIFVSFILFGIIVHCIIVPWIHRIFDIELSSEIKESYTTTFYSAIYIYIFFVSLLLIIENPLYLYPIGIICEAIGMFFGFSSAIYWEIMSRRKVPS